MIPCFFWFSGIRGYHGIFKGIDGIYIMALLMGHIYIYIQIHKICIYIYIHRCYILF